MLHALKFIGFGAQTAVGKRWITSAAAVRAGISRVGEHPYMVDLDGEPVRGAWASYLDESLPVLDRILELGAAAADEALESAVLNRRVPIAVVISLPTPRPGLPETVGERLLQALEPKLNAFASHISGIHIVTSGNAGGLLALHAAESILRQKETPLCLVGGVESWHDPDMLAWIDAQGRLSRAADCRGLIPAEAAAFALVAAPSFGHADLGRITSFGFGREEQYVDGQGVCTGAGLTKAWREVLASLPGQSLVTNTYIDRNPESRRADEHGFTLMRCGQHLANATQFNAPVASWGDVGAATGILLAQQACADAMRGQAGPIALISTASDGPDRAAAMLRLPPGR